MRSSRYVVTKSLRIVQMRTRFLIVDDSELVRHSLRTVLQANPEWEVSGEASNGADAVERFKDSRPNIVIVDFQMPGINGIETARRMMEIAPAVPIVLFTQHASPETGKACPANRYSESRIQDRCVSDGWNN
jgi:DNA-binding NarL/FixJ family response regulator